MGTLALFPTPGRADGSSAAVAACGGGGGARNATCAAPSAMSAALNERCVPGATVDIGEIANAHEGVASRLGVLSGSCARVVRCPCAHAAPGHARRRMRTRRNNLFDREPCLRVVNPAHASVALNPCSCARGSATLLAGSRDPVASSTSSR